jgi:hypothetical protein
MKTRIILSFIAALFMQFTTVSADNYTDGLMKLMNNEVLAIVNAKMLEQAPKSPNVNADYLQNQFKTDAVEWLAGHYRKNMSEKDFNDMISFFMQPEVMNVQKKVVTAASSSQGQELIQDLTPQVQALMMGGTPENLKEPDCDPQLKKELLRWMEINGTTEGLKASLNAIKGIIPDMAGNLPEEQKTMMIKMMDTMFSFMEKNVGTILLTSMVGKVDLKDMQILNAVENKPFFESYKKANLSVAGDISTFMKKVMAGMKKN